MVWNHPCVCSGFKLFSKYYCYRNVSYRPICETPTFKVREKKILRIFQKNIYLSGFCWNIVNNIYPLFFSCELKFSGFGFFFFIEKWYVGAKIILCTYFRRNFSRWSNNYLFSVLQTEISIFELYRLL